MCSHVATRAWTDVHNTSVFSTSVVGSFFHTQNMKFQISLGPLSTTTAARTHAHSPTLMSTMCTVMWQPPCVSSIRVTEQVCEAGAEDNLSTLCKSRVQSVCVIRTVQNSVSSVSLGWRCGFSSVLGAADRLHHLFRLSVSILVFTWTVGRQ
jgi:hypothetical protein